MVLHPEKDGKSLRIVHDLQPLNAVMVKDSGAPPILEFYAENLGGRESYTGLDLFVAFDHCSLAGPILQILQGDISFIIQEEMPNIAAAFMDDMNIRGPPTCYETNSSGWYSSTAFTDPPPQLALYLVLRLGCNHFEVVPENTGISSVLLGSISTTLTVSSKHQKGGGTFSVGKWTSVYQSCGCWSSLALTKDITLRIARFRRL